MKYVLVLVLLLVGCGDSIYIVDCEDGYKGVAERVYRDSGGFTIVTPDGTIYAYSHGIKCETKKVRK